MMSKVDEILKVYRGLTVVEVVELNRKLREEFGEGFAAAGVREPRRPRPSAGTGSVTVITPNTTTPPQNVWSFYPTIPTTASNRSIH